MVGKARFPLGTRTTAVNQTRLHAASLGMSFPVLSQFLPCSLLPDTSTRSSDSRAGKGGQPALECRLQGLGAPDAECRFSLAKNQAFSAQPPRVQSIYTHLPILLKRTVLQETCSSPAQGHFMVAQSLVLYSPPLGADAGGSPRASLLPVSSPVF